MPAPTHNFTAPTVSRTLRISVISDGQTFVTDLPAAKLTDTLRAFQDFAGLDTASKNCRAVAAEASEVGDAFIVCIAALWLFLSLAEEQQAGNSAMNRERLNAIVGSGGCAMLAVTTETRTGDWDFRLFQLPSRPASIRPHRAMQRDRRRRWQ
jgi:hypothetical protein